MPKGNGLVKFSQLGFGTMHVQWSAGTIVFSLYGKKIMDVTSIKKRSVFLSEVLSLTTTFSTFQLGIIAAYCKLFSVRTFYISAHCDIVSNSTHPTILHWETLNM